MALQFLSLVNLASYNAYSIEILKERLAATIIQNGLNGIGNQNPKHYQSSPRTI